MTTLPARSFAAAAAAAAAAPPPVPALHAIPTGKWSVRYCVPAGGVDSWTKETYIVLQEVRYWEELGALLREMGPHRITNVLLRVMKGDTSPLWEDKDNIHGGSYCLKVHRSVAPEVFQRYLVAAATGTCAKDPANTIVGVTISPKTEFCIIKIWNLDARRFKTPSDLVLLHDDVKEDKILYRKHTEQRM